MRCARRKAELVMIMLFSCLVVRFLKSCCCTVITLVSPAALTFRLAVFTAFYVTSQPIDVMLELTFLTLVVVDAVEGFRIEIR